MYARGVRSNLIFLDEHDRLRYLRLLADVVGSHSWRCLMYCLMGNHLHLLLETPRANLAAGMRRLHGDYASGFNKRHGFSGHLFQGRYGAVRIGDDAHLVTVVRYLDRNPVDAGLVRAAPDWRWSASAALRGRPAPPWLAIDRLLQLVGGSAEGLLDY